MIPQPRTILRQLNEILHHPDVDSITAPLHPHTITWEHHDDTPATNRYTRTASTSTPNMPPSTRHPPAPQTACPLARPSSSQSSIHKHPKLHAPQHPAVKLAKQHPPAPQTACPLEPAVKLAKQHPPAPQTACPLAPGQLEKQNSIHQHPTPVNICASHRRTNLCYASLDAHYSHVRFGIVSSHRLTPLRLTRRRSLDELGLPPDLGLPPTCSNTLTSGLLPMRVTPPSPDGACIGSHL